MAGRVRVYMIIHDSKDAKYWIVVSSYLHEIGLPKRTYHQRRPMIAEVTTQHMCLSRSWGVGNVRYGHEGVDFLNQWISGQLPGRVFSWFQRPK